VAALAPVVDSGRNSGDYAQLQQQQGGGHSRGGSGSPARSRHSPRLLDGTFGWRRRAVLLVHPALLNVPPGPPAVPGSMFEQHLAALQSSGSTSGVAGNTFRAGLSTSPTAQPGQIQGNTRDGGLGGTSPGLQPASGSVPLSFTPAEQQALLAMALAPMCLSGGGGWRLDVSSRGGGGQQLYNGAGKAALQSPQSPSVSAGNAGVGPGEKLAVADAVTVITLADVAPLTLVPHLPVQLQVSEQSVPGVVCLVVHTFQPPARIWTAGPCCIMLQEGLGLVKGHWGVVCVQVDLGESSSGGGGAGGG
jgi:hypothetical protein